MVENAGYQESETGDGPVGGNSEVSSPRDHAHVVSLQTKDGETLIGVPVLIGAAVAPPMLLRAPVRATMRALGFVARVFKLKIVTEQKES